MYCLIKYDSNGVRTSKTVNGVEYTYEYLNGKLMHETRGEKVFDYCYDANGQLYAVSYKANSSTDAVTYYFAHNWRGDITSIYDAGGNVVAKYEYDAWGNVLTVTNSNNSEITDPNHIANLNPYTSTNNHALFVNIYTNEYFIGRSKGISCHNCSRSYSNSSR